MKIFHYDNHEEIFECEKFEKNALVYTKFGIVLFELSCSVFLTFVFVNKY